MNLNNIVRNSLNCLYNSVDLTFTLKNIVYNENSRDPIITTETINLIGRLQPLDSRTLSGLERQTLKEIGFNIIDYQLFRLYVSNITITQADKIRQLGCTEFVYNSRTFKIIGKSPYDIEGWREVFCYLIG